MLPVNQLAAALAAALPACWCSRASKSGGAPRAHAVSLF
jgi:hypothetical protein